MLETGMVAGLTTSLLGLGCVVLVCGIALRRRIPGWTRAAILVAFLTIGVEGVLAEFAWLALEPTIFSRRLAYSIALLAFAPAGLLLFSVCFARGSPLGQVRQWQWALLPLTLLPVVPLIWFEEIASVRSWSTQDGQQQIVLLNWPGTVVYFALVMTSILCLTNLERTFRASVGTMRWRIKYAVIGMAGLLAVRLYTASQVVLYSYVPNWAHSLNLAGLVFACVCTFVALKRTQGGGVDLYPSKSAIYGSISVAVAGVYLLVVGVLFKLAAAVGGDSLLPVKSFLILTALGLVAAFALSDRLRLLTKQFVSRHFKRPIHDYRKLWIMFTDRTSSCRDVHSLSRETVRIISETVESLSVTLWLFNAKDRTLNLGASTSLSDEQAAELLAHQADFALLGDWLVSKQVPFALDSATDNTGQALGRLSPRQFKSGDPVICVPLIARDQLVGALFVGDRVAGVPLDLEDLDLLRCLGDQVAGGLLGLYLSEQIIRSKELEAFQLMATFFVHDLKNTASSLSLMLQNLPTQFANPAFREDALRVVAKAVTRMQDLITRLTSLRGEVRINPRPSDLTLVVEIALEAVQPSMQQRKLVRTLAPIPLVSIDPDQIQKVVVNLLLNAAEATTVGGEIRVETSERNGWAVLSVCDNGIGMSAEFMRNSLFRPFQTTKPRGMGIGMFQCKTLVEAHQGRIEVSSEPGKGTMFHVWLLVK